MNKRTKRLSGQRNDSISDMDFLMSLDPDLREYFDDVRLVKSTSKSTRKKKANFSIGDQVEVNASYGTIILGPYNSDNGKDTYEIECEDGGMITAEDDGNSIKIYVPPIEENEDDDLL